MDGAAGIGLGVLLRIRQHADEWSELKRTVDLYRSGLTEPPIASMALAGLSDVARATAEPGHASQIAEASTALAGIADAARVMPELGATSQIAEAIRNAAEPRMASTVLAGVSDVARGMLEPGATTQIADVAQRAAEPLMASTALAGIADVRRDLIGPGISSEIAEAARKAAEPMMASTALAGVSDVARGMLEPCATTQIAEAARKAAEPMMASTALAGIADTARGMPDLGVTSQITEAARKAAEPTMASTTLAGMADAARGMPELGVTSQIAEAARKAAEPMMSSTALAGVSDVARGFSGVLGVGGMMSAAGTASRLANISSALRPFEGLGGLSHFADAYRTASAVTELSISSRLEESALFAQQTLGSAFHEATGVLGAISMRDALPLADSLAHSLALLQETPSIQSLLQADGASASDFIAQALNTQAVADTFDFPALASRLEALLEATPELPDDDPGSPLAWERLKRHRDIILFLMSLLVAVYLSSQTDALVKTSKNEIEEMIRAADRQQAIDLEAVRQEATERDRQLLERLESKYDDAIQRCDRPAAAENLDGPYYEATRATALRVNPRSAKRVVGIVRRGELVQLLKRRKRWILIRRYDVASDSFQEGWVRKRLFEKVW